jgi:hypothetical protein
VIGEPNTIIREVKLEALFMHAKGIDTKNRRLAMALSDAACRRSVDGQMHLLTCLRLQPFAQD